MDMTVTLAQLVNIGEPLKTILSWAVVILVIVLAVRLLSRFIRFVSRRLGTIQHQATDAEVESVPEKRQFSVRTSKSSSSQAGKSRSWTSRSLFGKSLIGAQRELPRLAPGELANADVGDYIFGSTLTPALAAAFPESQTKHEVIKKELIEGGHYEPHAWQNLSALRYLGLMLPLIVFGLALVFFGTGTPQTDLYWMAAMVIGSVAGWALPRLIVKSHVARRRSEIEHSLPDVIDLLNMCVSQGLTIHSALARVSWEIAEVFPVMAQELNIVTIQSDMDTLEHALDNLNRRIDLPELHSLSSLLIQTERMGTNVSDALTDYSDGMRATLQQRADQKANTATFKLLFPTVLCLMPAVYMFLLGPAVVELSDFFKSGGVNQFNQVDINR